MAYAETMPAGGVAGGIGPGVVEDNSNLSLLRNHRKENKKDIALNALQVGAGGVTSFAFLGSTLEGNPLGLTETITEAVPALAEPIASVAEAAAPLMSPVGIIGTLGATIGLSVWNAKRKNKAIRRRVELQQRGIDVSGNAPAPMPMQSSPQFAPQLGMPGQPLPQAMPGQLPYPPSMTGQMPTQAPGMQYRIPPEMLPEQQKKGVLERGSHMLGKASLYGFLGGLGVAGTNSLMQTDFAKRIMPEASTVAESVLPEVSEKIMGASTALMVPMLVYQTGKSVKDLVGLGRRYSKESRAIDQAIDQEQQRSQFRGAINFAGTGDYNQPRFNPPYNQYPMAAPVFG